MTTNPLGLFAPRRYLDAPAQRSSFDENLHQSESEALALYCSGRYESSEKVFRSILIRINNPLIRNRGKFIQCVIHNIACCYFQNGNFFKAYLHYLFAFEIAVRIGDTEGKLHTSSIIDAIEGKFYFSIL